MSATREQWAAIIMQVMQLIYRQQERYKHVTFDQAKPYIIESLDTWTIGELNHFIMENFSHDSAHKDHNAVCNSAGIACTCID